MRPGVLGLSPWLGPSLPRRLQRCAGMSTASSMASAADAARTIWAGKLNLVDLAGSERVHITGATGEQHPSPAKPGPALEKEAGNPQSCARV